MNKNTKNALSLILLAAASPGAFSADTPNCEAGHVNTAQLAEKLRLAPVLDQTMLSGLSMDKVDELKDRVADRVNRQGRLVLKNGIKNLRSLKQKKEPTGSVETDKQQIAEWFPKSNPAIQDIMYRLYIKQIDEKAAREAVKESMGATIKAAYGLIDKYKASCLTPPAPKTQEQRPAPTGLRAKPV